MTPSRFLPTNLKITLAMPLATSLLLMTACASSPPPNEELAVARAAVDRASGPAAAEAPVEMAAARSKITRANAAFAARDYALARQLANEAEADATLAEAQSQSIRSNRALTEVRDGIRMLREEMARK